jgi:hypothetical protein
MVYVQIVLLTFSVVVFDDDVVIKILGIDGTGEFVIYLATVGQL